MHKRINTLRKLSNFLNIDSEILMEISENDYNIITENSYSKDVLNNVLTVKKIEIRKKNGGVRVVYNPTSDNLTNCLKVLNSKLKEIYSPPNCVQGYIKGRGIKTNASKHLGKKYILKIDIENYFDKITKDTINESLKNLGFHEHISDLIAKLTTHNGILVQGFHTSPTIANITFQELDLIFSKFKNFTYTRYADDLYFSSEKKIDIESKIAEELSKFGFTINTSKTKLMKRGQKQYVTGLTVFDQSMPRISKHKKKEIRQLMYYIKIYGYKGHIMHKLKIKHEDYLNDKDTKEKVDYAIESLKRKIKGWLLFINSIEPDFSAKYIDLEK